MSPSSASLVTPPVALVRFWQSKFGLSSSFRLSSGSSMLTSFTQPSRPPKRSYSSMPTRSARFIADPDQGYPCASSLHRQTSGIRSETRNGSGMAEDSTPDVAAHATHLLPAPRSRRAAARAQPPSRDAPRVSGHRSRLGIARHRRAGGGVAAAGGRPGRRRALGRAQASAGGRASRPSTRFAWKAPQRYSPQNRSWASRRSCRSLGRR